jgi:hypothetical protein
MTKEFKDTYLAGPTAGCYRQVVEVDLRQIGGRSDRPQSNVWAMGDVD